jgi:hypothetical protein
MTEQGVNSCKRGRKKDSSTKRIERGYEEFKSTVVSFFSVKFSISSSRTRDDQTKASPTVKWTWSPSPRVNLTVRRGSIRTGALLPT